MAGHLLRTKLFVPRVRRDLVARPRLAERLCRKPRPRLTLISAPPGSVRPHCCRVARLGARRSGPVAWLSLDESESRPATFWTYVVTALQTARPRRRRRRAAAPAVAPAADRDVLVRRAQRTRGALPDEVDLVLDDYHLSTGPRSRRRGVPAGAPPAARASGDQQPSRPRSAVGAAAGPRRAGRGPRRRPALHPDEVAAYLNDVTGSTSTPSSRRPGGADRRVDRGTAARGVVAPGTGRPISFIAEVCEQEASYVVRLAAEDLLDEVVHDVPVVPGEAGDEAGGVVASLRATAPRAAGRRSSPRCGLPGRRCRRRRRSSPTTSFRYAATSSSVKRRSAARTSTSSPRARSRASGRAGSARVLITRCTCGGRCSSRNATSSAIAGPSARW